MEEVPGATGREIGRFGKERKMKEEEIPKDRSEEHTSELQSR